MKHRQRQKAYIKAILGIAAAFVLIAAGYWALSRLEAASSVVTLPRDTAVSATAPPQATPEPAAPKEAQIDPDAEPMTVDGVTWYKKAGLRTCLIMGVDKQGEIVVTDDYWTAGQADFQLLLVVDENTQSYRLLHINRDTMCDIHVLDTMGRDTGLARNQICLAYALGNGGITSGQNAMTAVSDLLGGQQIDDYAAMNIEGLKILNDSVGGVTVTIEDDFSQADPTLIRGKTITLMGDQAEHFVRSRRNMPGGSNIDRMRRQRVYLAGLQEKMEQLLREDDRFLGELFGSLAKYVSSDLTASKIDTMVAAYKGYTYEGIVTVDGTADTSGTYVEFTPDPQSLQNAILELFYTQKTK